MDAVNQELCKDDIVADDGEVPSTSYSKDVVAECHVDPRLVFVICFFYKECF